MQSPCGFDSDLYGQAKGFVTFTLFPSICHFPSDWSKKILRRQRWDRGEMRLLTFAKNVNKRAWKSEERDQIPPPSRCQTVGNVTLTWHVGIQRMSERLSHCLALSAAQWASFSLFEWREPSPSEATASVGTPWVLQEPSVWSIGLIEPIYYRDWTLS